MKRRTFLDLLAKSFGAVVTPTPTFGASVNASSSVGTTVDKTYAVLDELHLLRSGVAVRNNLAAFVEGIPHQAYTVPQVYMFGNMKAGAFDIGEFEKVRAKVGADPVAYFQQFVTSDKTYDQEKLTSDIAECKMSEIFSSIPTSADLRDQVIAVEKTLSENNVEFSPLTVNDLTQKFNRARGKHLSKEFETQLTEKHNFKSSIVIARERGYTTQYDRYNELVDLHPDSAKEWTCPQQYDTYFLQITDTALNTIHHKLSGHFFSCYARTPLMNNFDLTENDVFVDKYLLKELYEPDGQKLLFEEEYMKQSWMDGTYQGLVNLQQDINSFTKENPGFKPKSLDTFLHNVHRHSQGKPLRVLVTV